MSTSCSMKATKPVTKSMLSQIKADARAYWLEGRHGLDDGELAAYSYLRAIELVLKINFNFDLPEKVDTPSEE